MYLNKFDIDLIVGVISKRKTAKRVYFERTECNKIQTRITSSNEIESDLKGKKVFAFDTKRHYTVDKIHKQWHKGYYIVLALVDDKRSHRMFFWKNINSQDDFIVKIIDESQKILHFIEGEKIENS